MPISAPSQIGLDILRSPALPEIAAARAETVRQSGAATEAFSLGSTVAKSSVEADKSDTPASFKRFEAMVLQTFIQNMLPKDSAAFYGKGMAGDMWKSLLAEKVAAVMADRGGIGIADRVLGKHYAATSETKPAAQTATASQPVSAGDKQEADGRFSIAPAVVDGMQRSLSRLLADEPAAPPANRNPVHHPARIDQMSQYDSYSQGQSLALRPASNQPMPATNLGALIGRIEEAVTEETTSIRTDIRFDIKASNARKSRYLYELTRALKGAGQGSVPGRTSRRPDPPARQARRQRGGDPRASRAPSTRSRR